MTLLYPRRSPKAPKVENKQANTNAYELTIHCRPLIDAQSSRDIDDLVVDDDHKRTDAEHRQDQPATFLHNRIGVKIHT